MPRRGKIPDTYEFNTLSDDAKARVRNLLALPDSKVHTNAIWAILYNGPSDSKDVDGTAIKINWRDFARANFNVDCLFEISDIDELDRLMKTTEIRGQIIKDTGFMNSMFNTHFRRILQSEQNLDETTVIENTTHIVDNLPSSKDLDLDKFSRNEEVKRQCVDSLTSALSPRFQATSWAFPYLRDYPRTALSTFLAQNCQTIDLGKIDSFMNEIKEVLGDYDSILNWNLSINEVIETTEVWFVTSYEIGSDVPVFNRFTQQEELVKVPSIPSNIKKYEGEEKWEVRVDNPDLLGCYLGETGTIFIFIDRIHEYPNSEIIFQVVLIHEFIHAILDLYRRPLKKENKWIIQLGQLKLTEESIDNALILEAYNYHQDIKNFIQSQPEEYRNAIKIDIDTLKSLLHQLIEYKINMEK